MTTKKDDQYEQDQAQFARWRQDEIDKAQLKAATLAKLGLTAEEVAALLS